MEPRGTGSELGPEEGQAPVAPALLILDEAHGLFPDLVDPAERIATITARLAHSDEAGRAALWGTLTAMEQAAVAHALTPAEEQARQGRLAAATARAQRAFTGGPPPTRNRAQRRAEARTGRP